MNGVYIPFYNEKGPHLIRLLNSLQNWEVKRAYFVDGPFPGYDDRGCTESDDGCREEILGYGYTILDAGRVHMPIKTNMALHQAAKDGCEAILIMGCDEYLEGYLDGLEVPDAPLARIPLVEHNPTGKYNRVENFNPRLICKPGLVRSVDIHWMFFYMNQMIDDNLMPIIEDIIVHCDDTLRPEERDRKMTAYQDVNVIREKKIINDKFIKQIIDMEYPPVRSLSGTYYWTCGCITWNDGSRLKKCSKHINKNPQL